MAEELMERRELESAAQDGKITAEYYRGLTQGGVPEPQALIIMQARLAAKTQAAAVLATTRRPTCPRCGASEC